MEEKEIEKFETSIGMRLPDNLRTVHNCRRWQSGWRGEAVKIRTLLRNYIRNRKAAGLEDVDLIHTYPENDYVKRVLPYIRMSIRPMMVNQVDNTIVLVNHLGGVDYHRFCRVISVRDLAMYYFVTAEYVFQQILLQEKKTGKASGLTLIYDLSGFQLKDYLNPYSPIMQTFTICANMIQEYYCDLLVGLYLLNPGTIVKAILQTAKRVLVPRTMEKLQVVCGERAGQQLLKQISANALPVAYGGSWMESSSRLNPHTCCTINLPIQMAPKYDAKALKNNAAVTLKPNKEHLVRLNLKSGQRLSWYFVCTGKLEFCIYSTNKTEDEPNLLLPRLVLCTPLGKETPEHGLVQCRETAEYAMEFRNHSSFFNVKIYYAWTAE